jgi:hypothetical protein
VTAAAVYAGAVRQHLRGEGISDRQAKLIAICWVDPEVGRCPLRMFASDGRIVARLAADVRALEVAAAVAGKSPVATYALLGYVEAAGVRGAQGGWSEWRWES